MTVWTRPHLRPYVKRVSNHIKKTVLPSRLSPIYLSISFYRMLSMWDLLQQTMHVIAQVGNDASAVADPALTTAAQAAPDVAQADQALTTSESLTPEALEAAQTLMAASQTAPEMLAVDQDMGMLGFIAQSDFVGKSLFALLVLMSLLSWYLIFAKFVSNASRRSRTRKFLKEFWAATSLEDIERKWAVEGDTEPFSRLTRNAINART